MMKRLLALVLVALTFILAAVPNSAAETAALTLAEMYSQAELMMVQKNYSEAISTFEALGTYSDASQMAMYCKAIMAAEDLDLYDIAVSTFSELGEFKDSKQMEKYYKARGLQAAGDTCDLEQGGDESLNIAMKAYRDAISLYTELALFKDCLNRMKDCEKRIIAIESEQKARIAADNEEIYQMAIESEEKGEYVQAISYFFEIKDYRDSVQHINNIKATIYHIASELEEKGSYQEALDLFAVLSDYKDSGAHIESCKKGIVYFEAFGLENEKKYYAALLKYNTIQGFMDANDRILNCQRSIQTDAWLLMSSVKVNATKEAPDKPYIEHYDYTYDGKGTLISMLSKTPDSTGTTTYEYDKAGNLIKGKQITATKHEIYYTYNSHGDMSTVKTGNYIIKHEYKYDEYGNMIEHHYGMGDNFTNGSLFTFEYEYMFGLPVSMKTLKEKSIISKSVFRYDDYGCLVEKIETYIDSGSTITTTYTYARKEAE